MSDEHFGIKEEEQVEIDPHKLEAALERLRSRQSLSKGIIFGGSAALIGAVLWAVITVVSEYQIGFMAIGVGFLVGLAVRFGGKGITPAFQITGASLALLGCLAGNLFAILGLISKTDGIPLGALFSELNTGIIFDLMKSWFSWMDLLFYAIAVYEGWRLSLHQVTMEDIEAGSGNVAIEP